MLRTLLGFFLLVSISSNAQIAFLKHYSNLGDDFGYGIVQLEDSSYVITGASSSFTEGHTQAFLLKIDSVGNYLWSNHYGGQGFDIGRRVLHKTGFGFYICGYSTSNASAGFDIQLMKIDETGNLTWIKDYGFSGWDRLYDAIMTSDTGTIMVGLMNDQDALGDNAYAIRTDSNGDTLWTTTLASSGTDYFTSVHAYQDSLFIACGSIYVEDSLTSKALISCIDDMGQVLWTDTIGPNGEYIINDFVVDGNVLYGVGRFQLPDSTETDRFALSYNLSTNTVVNLQNTAIDGNFSGEALGYHGDSTRIFVASHVIAEPFTIAGGHDIFITRRTGTLGWVNNAIQVQYQGDDNAAQMMRTSDGGTILVGNTTSGGSGAGNILVFKIGPGEVFPDVLAEVVFENLVSTPSLDNDAFLTIYPNPSSSIIHINTNIPEELTLSLYDINGQIVLTTTNHQDTIDCSMLSRGMYTVVVSSEDTSIHFMTKKLILQ